MKGFAEIAEICFGGYSVKHTMLEEGQVFLCYF